MENRVRRPVSWVQESDTSLTAFFELPGLDKKEIQINVLENGIEVKTEHTEEKKEIETKRPFFTKQYRSFYQFFSLPKTVEPEKAKADYTNGVLSISIPKKGELPKPVKRIEIQ